MGYYIDLSTISLQDYKRKLLEGYLPPSRMILKEKADERFAYFENLGITHVKALMQFLKKKDKLNELQQVPLFSGDYLKILLRELNSIYPKPNKLQDFQGLSPDTIAKLEKQGIKNTAQLYDKVITINQRKKLALLVHIRESEVE